MCFSASALALSHSQQAVPLPVAEQDHGEVPDRRGLDQREGLEQLIERPEATRGDDEGACVADEHHLAREEVAEAKPDVQVGVQRLLTRELDVAADRQRSGVPRAAVGGLHQAGAAAGDDRVAGPSQARADLANERVVGVLAWRSRRPEHRHRRPDVGEGVKAASELGSDVADTLGIGGAHPRRLVAEPQQQLLVEGQLIVSTCRRLAGHRPSVR